MNKIYDALNEKQKEAVFHTNGPLLILAGAGSGKTKTIIHRIAYLIEQGVDPYNIMAITFTNKAAAEMRERVDGLIGYGSEKIWVCTFHSTCARILRRYIDRLGYGTNFTIYDSDDQKSMVKDIIKRKNLDSKMFKERSVLSYISSAKDELTGPDECLIRSAGNYNEHRLAEIYLEYQNQLKKNNALDFDDLICLTVELFRENKDVLEYYQERFKYIMVDEYQDTNTAQFKLVSLLAAKYENLCVVGDDDQSIYRFRGANISNILDFEDTYPNAKVVKLEQNYRSVQNILKAANAVISNNDGRKAKALWSDKPEGERVVLTKFNNGIEEADGIVSDIKNKVLNEGFSYKDCAVLYRTNAQSRALEERFVANSIPYRVFGGVNFYQRKEIKDILAYLKTIDNGLDDLAVKRIINVPKRGIGAATIAKIDEYALQRELNFFDALDMVEDVPSIGKAANKIITFVEFIDVLRSKSKIMKISELIKEVIDRTEYYEMIENEAETDDEVKERKSNLDEFISKAVTYELENDEPSLGAFLEEVALVADIDNLDESVNRVSLMTIHSAKGLEFPAVYIAGMEEGIFPGYISISSGDIEDIEEERRLCYVGITRAMQCLNLSCARQRMLRGEIQNNSPSRFLKEIPELILDRREQGISSMNVRKSALSLQEEKFSKPAHSRAAFDKGRSLAYAGTTNYSSAANTQSAVKKPLGYAQGDRVRHFKFGEGRVLSIVDGGRDYEVTVEFDNANFGTKKMFASFAKMTKL
jgi:DNA helicase-2/ATP-dependent DNA helicase PcrA